MAYLWRGVLVEMECLWRWRICGGGVLVDVTWRTCKGGVLVEGAYLWSGCAVLVKGAYLWRERTCGGGLLGRVVNPSSPEILQPDQLSQPEGFGACSSSGRLFVSVTHNV